MSRSDIADLAPLHALSAGDAWSAARIIERLADAADHLLGDHDCDAHGWEGVQAARDAARELLVRFKARGPQRTIDDEREDVLAWLETAPSNNLASISAIERGDRVGAREGAAS